MCIWGHVTDLNLFNGLVPAAVAASIFRRTGCRCTAFRWPFSFSRLWFPQVSAAVGNDHEVGVAATLSAEKHTGCHPHQASSWTIKEEAQDSPLGMLHACTHCTKPSVNTLLNVCALPVGPYLTMSSSFPDNFRGPGLVGEMNLASLPSWAVFLLPRWPYSCTVRTARLSHAACGQVIRAPL